MSKDSSDQTPLSDDDATQGSSSTAQGSRSQDDYPMTGISKPGKHDVLCGRGGGTNNHEGNIRFRKMVTQHKIRYLAASKVEKPKVAREVVKEWRSLDPPGRFLARADGLSGSGTTPNSDLLWDDVGDKKAREKASQCLRERTADVIPFVQQMKQKQQLEQEHRRQQQQQQQQQQLQDPNIHSQNGAHIDAALLNQSIPASFYAQAQQGIQHGSADRSTSMPPCSTEGLLAALEQQLQQSYAGEDQRLSAPPNSFSAAAIAAANADNLAMPPPPPVSSAGFANFDSQEAQIHMNALASQQDADEMTLDEYRKSLQDFIATEVPLTGGEVDDRAAIMQSSRRDSWVKSFHSVDSEDVTMDPAMSFENTDGYPAAAEASSSTLHTNNLHNLAAFQQYGVPPIDEQSAADNADHYATHRPTMPGKGEDMTRSQKSAVSMFSDISDMSGMVSKTSRSYKMGASKTGTSNLSLMSELTDLSNNLSVMELSATGESHSRER